MRPGFVYRQKTSAAFFFHLIFLYIIFPLNCVTQEAREIFLDIVTKATDENGTIGMNYRAPISPTIYILQKQQLKIEELQNKIAELEKQMNAVQASLSNKKTTLSLY